jgi:hypothetical protein
MSGVMKSHPGGGNGDIQLSQAEAHDLERMLVDFEQIKPDVAAHIYRQAEARLLAQTQLFTGSITRSVTFSGIAATLGSICVGLFLTEISSIGGGRVATHIQVAILFGVVSSAILFLLSALVAFLACRVSEFNIPGNPPKSLIFNSAYLKLKNAMIWDAFHLEGPISENHAILTKRARLLTWSQVITILSPVLGMIAFALVFLIMK